MQQRRLVLHKHLKTIDYIAGDAQLWLQDVAANMQTHCSNVVKLHTQVGSRRTLALLVTVDGNVTQVRRCACQCALRCRDIL